jgi:hypothetical protein
MQVNQISAEEIQRMRDKAQPALQQVVDTVGPKLFEQVQVEVQKAAQ